MTSLKKLTCRVLAVSTFALSISAAQAGMIGADQAAANTAPTERGQVVAALDRADVAARLRAAGVDPMDAKNRVNSMSDQEVHAMVQDMQTAPAGADVTAWGWVGIVAIAALVWYFVIRR